MLSSEDKCFKYQEFEPEVFCRIDEAEDLEEEIIELERADGRVSKNFIYAYPPGIPIVAPGERITPDILEHILFAKNKGCFMTGPEDMNLDYLQVVS